MSKPNGKASNPSASKSPKKQAVRKPKKLEAAKHEIRLSPCTERYLDALTNPFDDVRALGACIPEFPAFNSRKITVFARGTATTSSATGEGFVYGYPIKWLASDANAILYTGSTFAGGAFVGSGTGVSPANTNSPFTAANLGTSGYCRYRIVGAGIRVKSTSTALNRGGTVVGMQEPNHLTLTGKTYANLRSYRAVKELNFDEKWVGVTYDPVFPFDNQYQDYGVDIGNQQAYLGLYVKSAAVSQPFSWEVVAHFEAYGTNVVDGTRDSVDPLGYAAAMQVIQSTQEVSADSAEDTFLHRLGASVKAEVKNVVAGFTGHVVTAGAGMVARGIERYLGPRPNPRLLLGA